MATGETKADDPHKIFNEKIKALESIPKRESDLLRNLTQADAERDIDAKLRWAEELVALLKATKKLQQERFDYYNGL
jgi:hypothetical protein